ncbi:MAG TPA: peptidyl-prolyl cis-trans isomerase [Candidatus Sulfotelmatobacter sp.]|nr:peptidyl-prolyl cis-trans isomerase [Candidatus Sulfotelmatobacter sp.]
MKVLCAITTILLMVCLPVRADLEDGISAIVNDKVITFEEVRDFTAPAVDVLQREYADQPDVYEQKLNATLRDGLETLIENQLILHEFETKYNPLPDSLVDEWVEARIKDKFGDRITCIRTLQAQGITFEKFRQEVRDGAIIEQLSMQKLSENKIIISPYKIETYYKLHQDEFRVGDQVQLRMIVINKIAPDDTAARQKADGILENLKKGSDFQELASLYSQDPEQKGSDWMETSVLRKELADAAATLEPGQTSGVIETPDECYIIQLEGRRAAHVKPLNDVRKSIETTLREQERKNLERRWIDSLRKKAFIRYFG